MGHTSTTDGMDATALVVRALTLYALAEFQSGHASTIRVKAEGCSFSVADNGRGHAINRTVAGSPYLHFIYTHLDYPFGANAGGPVQLPGIGMSLLNAFCSELSVTAHTTEGTLRMTYRGGQLCHEERVESTTQATGNTVAGIVSPLLQRIATNTENIEKWLRDTLTSNPSLMLHFNGRQLQAHQQNAA